MTTKYYHITGVPLFGPEVPLRKNFNEFAEDAEALNLYLLALDAIQKRDQSELLSFFQLGGIHGKPYVPWDNVQGIDEPTFGGYCTHGTVIFPTWHRPYVLLFEQAIWDKASSIAASYEDLTLKFKYQEALKRLRQPYYDWAADTTLHPLLNTTEEVTVVTAPYGKEEKIANPLVAYKFHPIDPSFTSPFDVWTRTLRHPSTLDADAHSQPDKVQETLDSASLQLRDNIFNLFQSVHDWTNMSNHTDSSNSLEAIHDSIHGYIGRGGHMADAVYAGFDPIFFLHHSNVDRLLALWQAINYTTWVEPGSSDEGSFTITAGQEVDTNTALTPFHIDDATFWNSTIARDYNKFGYTYPETCDTTATPQELRRIVIKAVFDLYGPRFEDSDAAQVAEQVATSTLQKSRVIGNPSANPGHGDFAPIPRPKYPSKYQDWYVVATVKASEFAKSGFVHIFLCETVPENDWLFAPERVGDVTIFKNTSGECANCNRREAAGETVSGRVPLTSALLKKGKDINSVENIKEYLKNNLHWRCCLVDGTVLPLENVPSLQVKLFSAFNERAEVRDGFEDFPRRHTPEVHRSITHGKLGGYRL